MDNEVLNNKKDNMNDIHEKTIETECNQDMIEIGKWSGGSMKNDKMLEPENNEEHKYKM